MDPRMNNILSERDEKRHAEMRAKMIGAVSQTLYKGSQPDFVDSIPGKKLAIWNPILMSVCSSF